MEAFHFVDIHQAHDCLVHYVINNGNIVKDERNQNTKEITNIVAHIENPWAKATGKGFWSGDKLMLYIDQMTRAENNQGFVYTYGNRLKAYFKRIRKVFGIFKKEETVNQIDLAVERLIECRESRRATTVTWDAANDAYAEEVPCMILADFKIRDGRLLTTALWRSHDIYGAWFPNIIALRALAKNVADRVGVAAGPIVVHSVSAHIYEWNWDEAIKGEF